jgi:hypothetical protein
VPPRNVEAKQSPTERVVTSPIRPPIPLVSRTVVRGAARKIASSGSPSRLPEPTPKIAVRKTGVPGSPKMMRKSRGAGSPLQQLQPEWNGAEIEDHARINSRVNTIPNHVGGVISNGQSGFQRIPGEKEAQVMTQLKRLRDAALERERREIKAKGKGKEKLGGWNAL